MVLRNLDTVLSRIPLAVPARRQQQLLRQLLGLTLIVFLGTGARNRPTTTMVAAAYHEPWSSAGVGRPEVTRRAIAGIWKVTPQAAIQQLPMKEFTVYPKKVTKQKPQNSNNNHNLPEILLMLKEDGSFQQYSDSSFDTDDDDDDENAPDIDQSWSAFQTSERSKQQQEGHDDDDVELRGFLKGTWDFLDGNLILAADRPEEKLTPSYSQLADGSQKESARSSHRPSSTLSSSAADTLLRGRVVAKYQTRLLDNPALSPDSNNNATTASATTKTTALDTHLSVPQGSINCGKFFYPRNHPSFFEQPMYHPVKRGSVTLRQILGRLNTETHDRADPVEKYQRSDFYNRTFLLSTHPIGAPKQQPPTRSKEGWGSSKSRGGGKNNNDDADDDEASKRTAANIRVMEVAFHTNNTFSTTAGLGGAAILRGKFDVIGSEKDQLWMQVIRFGFGRSVSGSVYSEGPMLSHEDAKAYWGTIQSPEDDDDHTDEASTSNNAVVGTTEASISDRTDTEDNNSAEKQKRLEVSGSVLDGWGLEPIPVARFILKEVMNDVLEDDDDEEEEEDDFEARSEDIAKLDPGIDNDGIIAWPEENGGSFQ